MSTVSPESRRVPSAVMAMSPWASRLIWTPSFLKEMEATLLVKTMVWSLLDAEATPSGAPVARVVSAARLDGVGMGDGGDAALADVVPLVLADGVALALVDAEALVGTHGHRVVGGDARRAVVEHRGALVVLHQLGEVLLGLDVDLL